MTIVGRKVSFTNDDGKTEIAVCVSSGWVWIKAIRADGSHIMLHRDEYQIVQE